MSGLIDKMEIVGITVGAVLFFGIAFWKTNYSAEKNYVPEEETRRTEDAIRGGTKRKKSNVKRKTNRKLLQ